jgi:hypothetical protein
VRVPGVIVRIGLALAVRRFRAAYARPDNGPGEFGKPTSLRLADPVDGELQLNSNPAISTQVRGR